VSRTVKVRIAVAVDPDGDWNSAGWSKRDGQPAGEDAMELACDNVGTGERRYWIEAELMVPEPEDVQGEVYDA
jgi:hypothetical protein